ncbi:SRPBCC domain-containing protein [Streptosporangium algeriense]|uniref:SRPBCC domain-containing protein n=1 Tax=Streptosporangium algeriense TaxID=1682748 RepID=A0ABW3DNP4_9ACTN
MGHEFEVRRRIELAATPEEVWQAIATGPGVDSWFMGRSRIEPRQGGSTRLTVGGATEEATITSWEPPGRFAYRTEPGQDGTFMAFEWLVEGRDRGSTVLRLVHEGFLEGDWESEYEAMRTGWDMYLHTLAAYLRYFPGRRGRPVTALKVGAAGPGKPGLLEPMGAHREHRGRGHGRAITVAAAAALQELGSSSATVLTPSSSTGALATYRSAGFRPSPEIRPLHRNAY